MRYHPNKTENQNDAKWHLWVIDSHLEIILVSLWRYLDIIVTFCSTWAKLCRNLCQAGLMLFESISWDHRGEQERDPRFIYSHRVCNTTVMHRSNETVDERKVHLSHGIDYCDFIRKQEREKEQYANLLRATRAI